MAIVIDETGKRVKRRLPPSVSFVDGYAEGWTFRVGECFKLALDIKYTRRINPKITRLARLNKARELFFNKITESYLFSKLFKIKHPKKWDLLKEIKVYTYHWTEGFSQQYAFEVGDLIHHGTEAGYSVQVSCVLPDNLLKVSVFRQGGIEVITLSQANFVNILKTGKIMSNVNHNEAPLNAFKPFGVVCFSYTNAQGETSRRVVTVHSVRNGYLNGVCHADRAFRTFRLDRIVGELVDADSGEPVFADAIEASRQSPHGDGPLSVCFTGFSASDKRDLQALATEAGLVAVESVTVSLFCLCCGPNAGPSKLQKARAQKVLILSQPEFVNFVETGEIPRDLS